MSLDLSQNEQTLQTGNERNMVLPENAYVRELLRIITKIFYIVMCTILFAIIILLFAKVLHYSTINFNLNFLFHHYFFQIYIETDIFSPL